MRVVFISMFLLYFNAIGYSHDIATDTLKAIEYSSLADTLIKNNNLDSGIVYYQKSVDAYHELEMWRKKYIEQTKILNAYKKYNTPEDFQRAIKIAQGIIDESTQTLGQNNSLKAYALYSLGFIYYGNLSEMEKALKYFERATEVFSKSKIKTNYYLTSHYAMGLIYRGRGEHKLALEAFFKAWDLRIEPYIKNHYNIFSACFYIANIYQYEFRQSDKAMEYSLHAMRIAENDPRREKDLISCYGNVAHLYGSLGYLEKAIFYLKKALARVENQALNNTTIFFQLQNSIGNYYENLGQNQKAEECYEKALEIKSIIGSEHKENLLSLAYTYINFGDLINKTDDFEVAFSFQKKALEILDLYFKDKEIDARVAIYQNITNYYFNIRDLDEALIYNQKIKEFQDSIFPKDIQSLNQYYLNEANIRMKMKQYELALTAIQKVKANKHYEYNGKGRIYLDLGRLEDALSVFQKGIINNLKNKEASYEYDWNPSQLESFSPVNLIESFRGKGAVLMDMYKRDGEKNYLKFAIQNFFLADSLINMTRTTFQDYEDKLLFNEKIHLLYETAITATKFAFEKTQDNKYLENGFYFFEKSRATILLNTIVSNQALEFSFIPDSILQKEKRLKIDLSYFNHKLNEAEIENDKTNIAYYLDKRNTTQQEYSDFIRTIEQKYPKYFDLKYLNKVASLQEVKKQLKEHSLLVEYFIASDSIYVLSTDREKTSIFAVHKPENLEEEIQLFRKVSSDFKFIQDSTEIADQLFVEKGQYLYELLLKPVIQNNSSQIDQLTIMPDGILYHLPFEILLSSSPKEIDYKEFPYLIKDYNIGYIISSSLLFQQENKNFKNRFGGFAPNYLESKNQNRENTFETKGEYVDLPYAREEVEKTADILLGDAWVNQYATEGRFKRIASQYGILHLSMHGSIDDRDPMNSKLIFSSENDSLEDGILHAYELYNLSIKTNLIVLSACNTGVGAIRKGEGVMSLSRAFSYAGSPNALISLWSVPDESTSEIFIDFYKELKASNTKDVSLRKAKIKYLESADPLHARPLFWGGFVLVGNLDAIEVPSFNEYFWKGGVFVLLALSFLFFIRSKSIR